MQTLTELGIKYKTDKATDHNFTDKYDQVLSKFRNDPVNFLEIGVYGGASVKMWKEYFQNGTIYALDIEDKKHFEEDRIVIDIADQGKRDVITNVFSGKEFDIILDDGGHRMDQQQISLSCLLPRVKSGGIFIIEDLHTSYLPDYWGAYNHPKDNSTLRMLMEMSTRRFTDMKYYISLEEIKNICNQIKTIEIFFNNRLDGAHSSCTAIITKL